MVIVGKGDRHVDDSAPPARACLTVSTALASMCVLSITGATAGCNVPPSEVNCFDIRSGQERCVLYLWITRFLSMLLHKFYWAR